MQNNIYKKRLDYLRRKSKRSYNSYIGVRDDLDDSIYDVAINFNILLDKERLDSYSINAIDFDRMRLELVDNEKGILYIGECANESELVDYSYNEIAFISVQEVYPDKRIEKLYSIIDNKKLLLKLLIRLGNTILF